MFGENMRKNSGAFVLNDHLKFFHFLKFSLFKFLVLAGPDRKDTPQFNEYFIT